MKKHTKAQKIREIQSHKDSSRGEQSPYWDYVTARNASSLSVPRSQECAQANPDLLPETEIAAPSTPQLLMGEAVEHLQGRQREVYLLTMREGKSLAEAAEVLGLSKGTAQTHKERAVKFITKWCQTAMAKGRV